MKNPIFYPVKSPLFLPIYLNKSLRKTVFPQDLLWSDPMDQLGRLPSPRGGGVLFGPDVTERSLDGKRQLAATGATVCWTGLWRLGWLGWLGWDARDDYLVKCGLRGLKWRSFWFWNVDSQHGPSCEAKISWDQRSVGMQHTCVLHERSCAMAWDVWFGSDALWPDLVLLISWQQLQPWNPMLLACWLMFFQIQLQFFHLNSLLVT